MKPTSILEKTLIVIGIILVIYGAIITLEKRKFESKYNSEIEKNIKIVNDSIEALNLRLKDLTKKQQNWTEDVQKESKAINDKLKKDEKAIDNYIVTDTELANFISRHENG